jgi:hypothetical protein
MKYRIPEHILHSKLDEETAILNLKNGEYYSLNETGALIWSLIDKGRSDDEILGEIANSYQDADEEVDSDLYLINELKLNGLVEEIL